MGKNNGSFNREDILDQLYGKNNRRNSEYDVENDYLRRSQDDNVTQQSNCRGQRHTHEYLGSVKIAELQDDPHNHRFAGVTGQAILSGNSHFHKLDGNTDFYENHFHVVADRTSLAIPIGNSGKHVHFVQGQTSVNDGHRHMFEFATLIDNPIGE